MKCKLTSDLIRYIRDVDLKQLFNLICTDKNVINLTLLSIDRDLSRRLASCSRTSRSCGCME